MLVAARSAGPGPVASGVGLAIHPAAGEVAWGHLALGMLGTWAAELSFAAVALATAVLFRSVAGTLLGMFLFLVFERFATWGLMAARSLVTSMSETGAAAVVRDRAVHPDFGLVRVDRAHERDRSRAGSRGWRWCLDRLAHVVAERVFSRTDVP